jgi:serine/threonine protein phosphatase PrpC
MAVMRERFQRREQLFHPDDLHVRGDRLIPGYRSNELRSAPADPVADADRMVGRVKVEETKNQETKKEETKNEETKKEETENIDYDINDVDENPNITIILATDGLWDNMIESDTVSDTNQFLQESINLTRTAQEIATALGNENDRRGRRNFGNSRDNATITVAKFTEIVSDV